MTRICITLGVCVLSVSRLLAADCNSNGIEDQRDFLPIELGLSLRDAAPFGLSNWCVPGDFDGDGNVDLANLRTDRIEVSLGKPDKEVVFRGASPTTIDGPDTLEFFDSPQDGARDMDGDGSLDLLVQFRSQAGDHQLAVAWGRGDGGFAQPQRMEMSGYVRSVAFGDLDGDGSIGDFVAAMPNARERALRVLVRPDRSFDVQSFALGLSPGAIILEDLNADGRLDAIAASRSGPSHGGISIRYGTADGSFVEFVTYEQPQYLRSHLDSLVAADFNGDGRVDIAGISSQSEGLIIGIQSDEGFDFSQEPMETKSFAKLFVEDFDGDGRLDLAATVEDSRHALLWANKTPVGAAEPVFSLGPLSGIDWPFRTDESALIELGGRPVLAVTGQMGSHDTNVFLFEIRSVPRSTDCNENGVPDECDIARGTAFDCDGSGIPDSCENPASRFDCNENAVPDSCETDCDQNGISDECDIRAGRLADTNRNLIADDCEEPFAFVIDGPDTLYPSDRDGRVEQEYVARLSSFLGDERDGAQGWLLAIAPVGLAVLSATTDGTIADPDGGFFQHGFQRTVITSGDGNHGVVSAVVLSVTQPITLEPNSVADVLRFTLGGFIEEDAIARLEFRDRNWSGRVQRNSVTEGGNSYSPHLMTKSIWLRESGAFLRGDVNGDGGIDISDSVAVLSYLFLGGEEPPCLDAADTDDSGSLDLTDGHAINVYLFLGGTQPPSPGPYVCGPDPTADKLFCRAGECVGSQ
ncbi:MAG: FG-GAP-like repeat-containing protein [Planctomycetota bacterium]